MKASREIDIMQFHLLNALMIDGFLIKSGMNIIRRVEKGGSDYVIFHSNNFNTPYTHFPLDHIPSLINFISKKLIESGMVEIDDKVFDTQEIRTTHLKIVENISIVPEIIESKPKFKVG